MKLGEKIKLVRKHRGLTQRELGERLHLDGNAANRIAQYESGFRTPKEDRIQEIVECPRRKFLYKGRNARGYYPNIDLV